MHLINQLLSHYWKNRKLPAGGINYKWPTDYITFCHNHCWLPDVLATAQVPSLANITAKQVQLHNEY